MDTEDQIIKVTEKITLILDKLTSQVLALEERVNELEQHEVDGR